MPKGIQSSNGLQFVSNENRGYNDGSIYIKKRGNGHRTYSKASIQETNETTLKMPMLKSKYSIANGNEKNF
jgi:hypothetical protein